MSQEDLIKNVLSELSKALCNCNIILLLNEKGSGAVSINGNLPYSEMETFLKEIGSHLRISDNLKLKK